MNANDSWKLLVFRDGKGLRSGTLLFRQLRWQTDHVLSLRDFNSRLAQEELVEALLRSGELECGVCDHPDGETAAATLATVTDEFAAALIAKRRPRLTSAIEEDLLTLSVPEHITLSPPEGFCYYAVHPLDYADLLSESATDAPAAGVIGIRSIGTTLSAVVSAWFNLRGIPAERITVRPAGHPFDRCLSFSDKQRQWIAACCRRGARFFIVDEGPGLSGSSFLAVAEALAEVGVSRQSIVLLPSSVPNLDRLLAPNAAARWNRFQTLALQPTRCILQGAVEDITGGAWRSRVFSSESQWPAVWSWTERKKYLSPDGRHFFRFDGHGHYGKAARRRSEVLAQHGWGPDVSCAGDGFSQFPWVRTTQVPIADRNTIVQLARYCALRAEHFAHESVSQEPLEEMARVNLDRALGLSIPISLPIERPAICDGRMMPYEWRCLEDGRLQKLDASSHGDDHFYPGPTDIAWDIAGVIVEWKLDSEAAELLVSEYKRIGRDAVELRLASYVAAYSAFRLAFTISAAPATCDVEEQVRFTSESQMYQERLKTASLFSAAV